MGLIDRARQAIADQVKKDLEPTVAKSIFEVMNGIEGGTPNLLRKDNLSYPLTTTGVRRYQLDYQNNDMNMRRKPQSGISFEIMRQFSTTHEITRACINVRKREITQLDWDIVPVDPEDKNPYTNEKALLQEFFKNLGGYKVRFRKMIDQIVEDLLALDAIALYRIKDKGGQPMYYIPIDPATIKLRLDDIGNTPEPPEVAYKQIVRGQLVAELTTDDLIYDMLNARSNTPYGLAPLESLIIIVSTNLKSNLYNLNYLTDGNIPDGIFAVPQEWSPQQIREYQEVWDAFMAGDARATSKLRFVPGGPGTNYTATKKPTDMQFKELNDYIMKITCALFDVTPQEIGFTEHQSTRANASEQSIVQMRKGVLPLTNFLAELFTDIIQHDLGIKQLKFAYMGLEDHDAMAEAQTRQVDIFTGVRTLDEVRKEIGLDPLGIDRPFVVGLSVQPLDVAMSPEGIQAGKDGLQANVDATNAKVHPNDDGNSKSPDDNHSQTSQQRQGSQTPKTTEQASTAPRGSNPVNDKSMLDEEIRKFKTYATNRVKQGKALRPFQSDVLPSAVVDEINSHLSKAVTIDDIKELTKSIQLQKIDKVNHALQIIKATPHFATFKKTMAGAIKQQAQTVATKLRSSDDTQTLEHADMLDGWVAKHMPPLNTLVSADQATDYFKQAFNHTVKTRYKDKGFRVKADAVNFDITNPQYLAALQDQSNSLLNKSSLDATTRQRIIELIADGKAAAETNDQIANDIISEFNDISQTRADLIARTETAQAAGTADLAAAQENGVATKVWVVAGPGGDECDNNQAAGPIPVDATFPTGDDTVPAHPNCECYVDWGEIDLDALANGLWDGS